MENSWGFIPSLPMTRQAVCVVPVVCSCFFEKIKNYLHKPGISWEIFGGVLESEKRSCAVAKLGEEIGTEQMGGGGKRGVGISAYTSVTRSDKLLMLLDYLKCTNLFLILLFCKAAGRLRALLLN